MKDERTAQWDGSHSPISGLELAYNTTTVLRVKAGTAVVNGIGVAFSQTDYTSASTMKSVANATVTLAANSAYWVFLSSGGVIGIEVNDGTGDGAVPVFDTALDYWKAASTGAAWRRIGKFWTNGSAQIHPFTFSTLGRIRRYTINNYAGNLVVAGTNNGSYTAVPNFSTYATADDAETLYLLSVTTLTIANGGVEISIDGGTSSMMAALYSIASGTGTTGSQPFIQQNWAPYTGTAHYRTVESGALGYVGINGYSQFV